MVRQGEQGARAKFDPAGPLRKRRLIADAKVMLAVPAAHWFLAAEVADRHWGKHSEGRGRLKRAGLDAIVEAPVDLLRDAEDDIGACLDAGLPVRCLSLQSPIEIDGRSSWLIHLRDLLKKFPLIDTVNPLSREQSVAVPTTGYEECARWRGRAWSVVGKENPGDWAQYGPKWGAGGAELWSQRSRFASRRR